MRRNAIGILVAVVVVALTAGGCGSAGDKPLTRAEFTAKVTAICKQRTKNASAARKGHRSFAAAVKSAYPILQRELKELQAVKPPASIKSRWDQVMAIEALQARELGLAIEGHPDRSGTANSDVNVLHKQANIKRELNLSVCV